MNNRSQVMEEFRRPSHGISLEIVPTWHATNDPTPPYLVIRATPSYIVPSAREGS